MCSWWQIDLKIKAFQAETITLAEQRQNTLKDLETRQRALSKQAEEYNERSRELSKVLDQVKSGKIFVQDFMVCCYIHWVLGGFYS